MNFIMYSLFLSKTCSFLSFFYHVCVAIKSVTISDMVYTFYISLKDISLKVYMKLKKCFKLEAVGRKEYPQMRILNFKKCFE